MKRPPISACIITYNEEVNIRKCLESVEWTDEIVVVDSYSTDNTFEIAKEYTTRETGPAMLHRKTTPWISLQMNGY